MEIKLYNQDNLILLKGQPDNSIDCIYTDIPYLYDTGKFGYSDLGRRIQSVDSELKNIKSGIDFSILDDFVRVMKK